MTAVPAYNVDKFRAARQAVPPQGGGYLGYVVELDGFRVYHAGDTDWCPTTSNATWRCIPVSGTFVMTADEAAAGVRAALREVVVPMHYADIVGTRPTPSACRSAAASGW